MQGVLDLPAELAPTAGVIASFLGDVTRRFDAHLASDLPPVSGLVGHVERYRGKMLRPMLVGLFGLAAHPEGAAGRPTEEHATLGAVCEMVHMATLVHDDVLDEAETRRRGATVNRLHGNEAAVILGDYLIAGAYHLCSTLADRRPSLAIGRASMVMCAGELLQLHHRDDFSLDERTYFEIVERKTAELIGTACEMGALASGAGEGAVAAAGAYGRAVGVAFQIQDDLLDLTGQEAVVGKSVGKDLEKGKMTLAVIHHLARADAPGRGRMLRLVEEACSEGAGAAEAAGRVREMLERSGSVDHARGVARGRVARARAALEGLSRTPARRVLEVMAEALVERRL